MTTFPAEPLQPVLELLLDYTWTDVSSFLLDRAPVTWQYGRTNETQTATAGSCTVTLRNDDGRFSPKNTSGAYYPYLTRNTQARLSLTAESATSVSFSGYLFWGEIASFAPAWNQNATDNTMVLTVSGVLRRLTQSQATIGSPMRRYSTKNLPYQGYAPLAYWPLEDASGATAFAAGPFGAATAGTWTGTPSLSSNTGFPGSGGLPELNGAVVTLPTGISGTPSSSGSITQNTPGTYQWTAPPGVTSVDVQLWGAGGGGGSSLASNGKGGGGGGGGQYATWASYTVTPGTTYSYTVGAGGAGLGGGSNGGGGGASLFNGTALSVAAGAGGLAGGGGGGAGGSGTPPGSPTATHNGGSGASDAGVGGPSLGGGGGSSGGTSAAGNSATTGLGAAAVTGGGAGGNGSVFTASVRGGVPGGGGGGGAINPGNPGFGHGANGAAGQVAFSWNGGATSPVPANVVTMLVEMPAAGDVNGGIVARMYTYGTVDHLDLVYLTASGGSFELKGYNSSNSLLFTSATLAPTANGTPLIILFYLSVFGTSITYGLQSNYPGGNSGTTTAITPGTLGSASVGSVSSVVPNYGGTLTGATTVGHVVVQQNNGALSTWCLPADGYTGEYAGQRFARLCNEESIGYETGVHTLTDESGDPSGNTPQMGPQPNDTFLNVLQQVEDCDRGQLYETIDQLGLGYRTRVSQYSQDPAVTLDYSQSQVSPPLSPAYDDLLVRNDFQLTRGNGGNSSGSMVVDQVTSGPSSIQPPPNGVGDYLYQLTVNVDGDAQLSPLAHFMAGVGTADEVRFPQVTVNLAHPAAAGLFATVPAAGIGDLIEITNPPGFFESSTVRELCSGVSGTLSGKTWILSFNTIPESPYDVALNGNPHFTGGSTTDWNGFQGTLTAVQSPAGALDPWFAKFVSNGTAGGVINNGVAASAAVAGFQYVTLCYVYSPVDTQVDIGITWVNSGSGIISTSVTTVTVGTGFWLALSSGLFTAPATTAFAYATVGPHSPSSGTTLYASAIMLVPWPGIW